MNTTPTIIPQPQSIQMQSGSIQLSNQDQVSYPDAAAVAGDFLCSLTQCAKGPNGRIQLILDPRQHHDEGYTLRVQPLAVQICASTHRGLFYGIQSFRQCLPPVVENNGIQDPVAIPCMTITDWPRFAYRGHMLDVARHMISVDEIKRLLDQMALHKLNYFHWHLTDDQGFRIEIHQYPLLTQVGAYRQRTQTAGFRRARTRQHDNTPYGGYYTQDEVQEIIEYATQRFITIIPEIDVPGHCMAMLAAYPSLGCTGGPYEVETSWGIMDDILCVGKEDTYTFIQNVMEEILNLFPGPYIHIGGDEVPNRRWTQCPDCQKKMKEHGFQQEKQLKTSFINRLAGFIQERGRTVIGWDELLDGSIDPNVTIQYWTWSGKSRTRQAIKQGRNVIFSPFTRYYLDYAFQFAPLKRTYNLDPAAGLPYNVKHHIQGTESTLWTERVRSIQRLHWQTYPQMTAISETAWTLPEKKNYADFLTRLSYMEKRYQMLGIHHAIRNCYTYHGWPRILKMLYAKDHIAESEYRQYNRQPD